MNSSRGLTFIELMVVLAIVAVLMGLAAPSLRELLVRWAADTAAAALADDFRLARSEALKRSDFVTICRTLDGSTCAATRGSWHTGWLVFVDHNSNAVVDLPTASTGAASASPPPPAAAPDQVLRVQPPLPWVAAIESPRGTTDRNYRFRPSGLSAGAQGSLLVTADALIPGGSVLLCISAIGRIQPRPGASAC